MSLPPCTLLSEELRLDVGRGFAVADLTVEVAASPNRCELDAGAVLRAREEGRTPPEVLALRVSLDGRDVLLGGPRARARVEVPARGASVRFVAALRGDRFAAVPLSTFSAHVRTPVRFRARTTSAWGEARIAGVARWTDVALPILVLVDPTRDHEPPDLAQAIGPSGEVRAIVVDAGPVLGREPTLATEASRTAALAKGGAAALTVLLADLPLSIATAPDDRAAIAILHETARAARSAALARDPIFAAIGQRLVTAIGTGFSTCRRPASLPLPRAFPAPPREMIETGLLDDPDSGCPTVDDLLAANRPDLRIVREASVALSAAADLPLAELPRVGPATPAASRREPKRKTHKGALTAVLAALAAAALALSFERRSR